MGYILNQDYNLSVSNSKLWGWWGNERVRKSVFTPKYDQFRLLLIQARKDAGITQVELARKLARPQSFVSKLERGERRIDVIEFLEIAQALGINVSSFLKKLSNATSSPKKHHRS